MQSSILNKTGLSSTSSTASKVNLKNKFGNIEQAVNSIDSDLRKLMSDTNVFCILYRNRKDLLSS